MLTSNLTSPLTLEELENLPYLKTAIDNGVSKLLELEARKNAIRSGVPSGMPGAGKSQKGIDDFLLDILEHQERIEKDLQEIREEWKNTHRKISQIQNLRIRLIILYRFEDHLTWQEVADKIGGRETEYSTRNTFYKFMKRQEALSPDK